MRHPSALSQLKTLSLALMVLLLGCSGIGAGAQVTFDGLDFVVDRGSFLITNATALTEQRALRLGYNNFPQTRQNSQAGFMPFWSYNAGTGVWTFNPNPTAGYPLPGTPLPSEPNPDLPAYFTGNAFNYDVHDLLNNNPGYGVRRWVWPDTADLPANNVFTVDNPNPDFVTANPPPYTPYETGNPVVTIDPNDKSNYNYSFGAQPRDALPRIANASADFGIYSDTYGTGVWTIPPGDANFTYRVAEGGFSFGYDATQPYNFDYGYCYASTQNIVYTNSSCNKVTAAVSDLIPLPYVPANIYNAVHNTLTTTNYPLIARWSMGTYNEQLLRYDTTQNPPVPITQRVPIPTGDFHIQVYSPGSGTKIQTGVDSSGNPILVAHPNVYHAWVQVSWYNTFSDSNTLFKGTPTGDSTHPWKSGAGGLNDPEYSRWFLIDLSAQGWHDVQAGATATTGTPVAPAVFHYTAPANYNPQSNGPQFVASQIVVSLYPVTPDDITDTTLYATAPLVTADAVRFIQNGSNSLVGADPLDANGNLTTAVTSALNLGPIQPTGRVLGPIASTNKLKIIPSSGAPNDPAARYYDSHPLFYVAREETFSYSQVNPPPPATSTTAAPIDPTVTDLQLATDPEHTFTRPVFYCFSGEDEALPDPSNPPASATDTTRNLTQPSYRRIRWRYIGMPDSGSGTASASPLVANVRCRDGVTRTMVFFVTTSQDGTLGHVYAFDPLGKPYNSSTNTYSGGTTTPTPYNPVGNLPLAAGDFNTQLPFGPAPSAVATNTYTNAFVNEYLNYFKAGTLLDANGNWTGELPNGTLQPGEDGIDANGNPTVPGLIQPVATSLLNIPDAFRYPLSAALLPSRTTRCYWIYPSERPSLQYYDSTGTLQQIKDAKGNPLDAAEPTGVANIPYHDPNYSGSNTTDNSFYPAFTFGNTNTPPTVYPDQPSYGTNGIYYDGDIVSQGGSLVVRPDTQIFIGGITAAPVIMDDPDNPGGAQILVITGSGHVGPTGNSGGRIIALDAGGRGDYDDTKFMPVINNTNPNVAANYDPLVQPLDPTQPPVTIPGTTQRLWTWPHFGTDAWHRVNTDYTVAYTYLDDTLHGNFPNSPAWDPEYPTVAGIGLAPYYRPLMVPSDDGHIYAVLPFHDRFQSVNSNQPEYDDAFRTYWTFPNENLGSSSTLGNTPSTPAVFQASSGNRYLYFTSDTPALTGIEGRVYCIREDNVVGARTSSTIPFPAPTWIYPYSPLWPYEDPNNANATAALSPGFTNTAPVALRTSFQPDTSQPAFTGTANNINGLPYDMVYAIQNDGTVIALAAEPTATQFTTPPNAYNTVLYSTGGTQSDTIITGHTLTTPAVSLISANPNELLLDGLNDAYYGAPGNDSAGKYAQPFAALLYSDDNGQFYGIGLHRSNDGTNGNDNLDPTNPANAPLTILPLLYTPADPSNGAIRDASPILSNAVIAQGDHGGQIHGYSIGDLGNLYGDTVPGSEGGGANGDVSIDIRTVNYYLEQDFDNFMLTAANQATGTNGMPESPGFAGQGQPNGAVPSLLTQPAPDIFANEPFYSKTTGPFGVGADWGEYVYIAAWGVYHSQPRNGAALRGVNIPRIDVTFNVTQTGPSTTQQITVPAITPTYTLPPDDFAPLPGDLGYPAGDAAQLTIYGIDPNLASPVNAPGGILTGPTDHVYVWVAKYKLRIVPTATNPFQPGVNGLRVSAYARITQELQSVPTGGGAPQQPFQAVAQTLPMGAGQHDSIGKQNIGVQNVNDRARRGRSRPLYITNPLALTVRSFTPNGQGITDQTGQPNIFRWAGSVENGPYNNILELFGNGSEIGVTGFLSAKSVYAPVGGGSLAAGGQPGLAQPGNTVQYTAMAGTTQAPAIYVMDRSNLAHETGSPLQIKNSVTGYKWHGDVSSVMNPLPWDNLPDDIHTTSDYPALNNTNVHLTLPNGSNDLVSPATTVGLNAPLFPDQYISHRQPQPLGLDLRISVPNFFPANMNRGQVNYKDQSTGNSVIFGSTYVDAAGNTRGTTTANQNNTQLMGPLSTTTGVALGTPGPNTYPAGGYITQFQIRAVLAGQQGQTTPRRTGTVETMIPFESGLCVAPSIKMDVNESVLDFGSMPMGTGYSGINAPNSYTYPFAPTGTSLYQNPTLFTSNPPVGSPWDDPNQFGEFFQPFTLTNNSNINLVDLQFAKLAGQPQAKINPNGLTIDLDNTLLASGVAVAYHMASDRVNNLLPPPLVAVPFQKSGSNAWNGVLGTVGNIGIVTSFDHTSNASRYLSDQPLWPIGNPAVDSNVLATANLLYNYNNTANGGGQGRFLLDQWTNGSQPRPTLHKPRPTDGQGTTASIPDVPYAYTPGSIVGAGATTASNFATVRPKIGISVPIGTPAGTYTLALYPYEDNLPVQWREWEVTSGANTQNNLDYNDQDGMLNQRAVKYGTSPTNLEPVSNSPVRAKITVREARLTGGASQGDLPQIDFLQLPQPYGANPTGVYNTNRQEMVTPVQPGFNAQPAVLPYPTLDSRERIYLYWTTNRQPSGSPYTVGVADRNGNAAAVPASTAPIGLAFSSLQVPYDSYTGFGFSLGDAIFGNLNTGTWWDTVFNGSANNANQLFPGYDGSGQPLNYAGLFPSAAPAIDVPFVSGTPQPNTVRYGSPGTAVANHVYPAGLDATYALDSNEAYLVWFGQVDKQQTDAGTSTRVTESRTFYTALDGAAGSGPFGVPDSNIQSFLNDPNVSKLGQKPLLVKFEAETRNGINLPAVKLVYLFWYGGAQANTSLYYNANLTTNLNGPFSITGWQTSTDPTSPLYANLGDLKVTLPNVLSWESDPYPVLRRVTARDPYYPNDGASNPYRVYDVIDLYYTGVLKGRQKVEVLMCRYGINRGEYAQTSYPFLKPGQLFLLDLPPVANEKMANSTNFGAYLSRDAGWDSSIANGIDVTVTHAGTAYDLTSGITPTIDKATNLLFYTPAVAGPFAGGRITVNPQTGTVTFPNIGPKVGDIVTATYTPQIMRLSTYRDSSNALDTSIQSLEDNPDATGTIGGDNSQPTVIFDRGTNLRGRLSNPPVLYNQNGSPDVYPLGGAAVPNDRLWVMYHKAAGQGGGSDIYYKPLRLMVRLPYPVAVNSNNGQQSLDISVTGNLGPYEVDYLRGFVFFTQVDEGNTVTISNYTGYNLMTNKTFQFTAPLGNTRSYRVAWGDETTATLPSVQNPVTTTALESPLIISGQGVNESEVTAFKDPVLDKMWIFWTSTRGGVPDLFYECLAPQFYPTSANQQ